MSFRTMTFRSMILGTIARHSRAGLKHCWRKLGMGDVRNPGFIWMRKTVSNTEISMFVNVNAHPGSRPKAVGELGELSRARIVLSEFKYTKGSEIYGEA